MSKWSYINGVITVYIPVSNQAYKEFVLKTTLASLPDVRPTIGRFFSEGGMDVFINVCPSHDISSDCDENLIKTNQKGYNIINRNYLATHSHKPTEYNYIKECSYFFITVQGSLRDVCFEDGLKKFNHWLVRLSKKLWVDDICVKITGDSTDKEGKYKLKKYIFAEPEVYSKLYEIPSDKEIKQLIENN